VTYETTIASFARKRSRARRSSARFCLMRYAFRLYRPTSGGEVLAVEKDLEPTPDLREVDTVGEYLKALKEETENLRKWIEIRTGVRYE